jgi:hypothetical protein
VWLAGAGKIQMVGLLVWLYDQSLCHPMMSASTQQEVNSSQSSGGFEEERW